MDKIAIIMTVHNRIKETIVCLDALFQQKVDLNSFNFSVFLTDDGSEDNTATIINRLFPNVTIFHESGNLFWNGGMRLAFGEAIKGNYDYYFWLNNDTILFPDALKRLLEISIHFKNQSIIVGSTQEEKNGQLSYGGLVREHSYLPLKLRYKTPAQKPIHIDTMNGNCVLIPKFVVDKVGNLDQSFSHYLGDYDYGLRAKSQNIPIYLAPGFYGSCNRNKILYSKFSLLDWLKFLFSNKGIPPKEWGVFARRHGGFFWPVFWLSPYITRSFRYVKSKLKDSFCTNFD